MKKSIMVWAASAVFYLGVVIAGYSVYASMNPKPETHDNHTNINQKEET